MAVAATTTMMCIPQLSLAKPAVKPADLPNFHQVSSELYRGGQPTTVGIEQLKAKGIKTVISLRHNRHQFVQEAKEVSALGMKFEHVSMDGLHKPSPATLEKFFAIVNNPANQPAFVHCQFGADRTGTLVAIYRQEKEHWTAKQAYDEMLKYGFETKYVWMADAVFDYEEDRVHAVSNERPLNVKMLDSLQTALNLRPNFKSASSSN
jgi:protein tyrosine/serine phosphatase